MGVMDYLPIFVAVSTAAIVLQALVLFAMYMALRKTSTRLESLSTEVSTKVLPTAEMAHSMLTELRPKIESTVTNVSEASALMKNQLERMDATLNDVIDRTRLQVIRADEMIGRTLDRVEETTEMVQRTVVSPVRQISGLAHALGAGFGFFVGGKRRRRNGMGVSVPQDEMFI
jgi:methyl-accepting chemotaxis protein